jgi:hypothetical protein
MDSKQSFDRWYTDMELTERKGKEKKINGDSKKVAMSWSFFQQGALKENGKPMVKCAVCDTVYIHPAIFGTKAMTNHIEQKAHLERAKILVFGNAQRKDTPSKVEILTYLQKNGSVGVKVRRLPGLKIYILRRISDLKDDQDGGWRPCFDGI